HADRLVMANIAQTVNVLQAMLLTDGQALVLTPSYHVFEMNKGHHDAEVLALALRGAAPVRKVQGKELVTFSASASTKDGRVLISLTNLDAEEPLDVRIDVRGATVQDLSARLLTAGAIGAHNTATDTPVAPRPLDSVRLQDGTLHVTLPAHSFATVGFAAG
ncbi:alpha-L-arabinofuranosidase C-terminal domain-containing protein, partial [Kineococcus gypseus]|uniref:alpha-L-arabinofuranosidase C-terminal domain-containing protein n=1 Tax=Kineococcus gypseus TaxID=1637102 RepID=UPI003D7DA440